MIALMWKEARELAPVFGILLGACVAGGIADVASNWRADHFAGVSVSFCWLISLAAAFLAGANVFARESRGNLCFLSSWPVKRGEIWAAKLLVTASFLALLALLSPKICVGLLALRGYDAAIVLDTASSLAPAETFACLGVASFALALMFSTIVDSSLTAVGLTLLAEISFGVWYGHVADFPMELWAAFAGSGVAILASAWGFTRTPVLERRKRVLRVLLACALLLVLLRLFDRVIASLAALW